MNPMAVLGFAASLDWGKITCRQPHVRAQPSSRCPCRRARRLVREGAAMQPPHARRHSGEDEVEEAPPHA